MQPTYLPWSGYLNLMAQVDEFVFLDDVQFERQSWQTRNRILLQGREHMLVVPVARQGLDTRIDEATIAPQASWRADHWKTLEAAYRKSAHGEEALALLHPFYTGPEPTRLARFNEDIVRGLASALGLRARLHRASELGCGGQRSHHVAEICAALGCDEYLSPPGARDYLLADGFAEWSGVRLLFQRFEPAPYAQRGAAEFVPRLSLVDVLASLGAGATARYVQENGDVETLQH